MIAPARRVLAASAPLWYAGRMRHAFAARIRFALMLLAIAARAAAGASLPLPSAFPLPLLPLGPAGFVAICHAGETQTPAEPAADCALCPICLALSAAVPVPHPATAPLPHARQASIVRLPPFPLPPRSPPHDRPPGRGPPILT